MSSPAWRTRNGIFILLRRLCKPLITVYAVLGFTLVPGVDPDGRPWTMSFLHAFYFVSFLGTTTGLGEIPYPFSDVQHPWATAAIYGTVVAWLYAIGGLFSVLQDPLSRRISDENSVERAVRRLMHCINPGSTWGKRFRTLLLEEFPALDHLGLNLIGMGVDDGWERRHW